MDQEDQRSVVYSDRPSKVHSGGWLIGGKDAALVAPEQVELEDVGQLVGDQLLQLVERHVAVDADPEQGRLGNAQDALRDREDVGLLEVGHRRVVQERDGLGQLRA